MIAHFDTQHVRITSKMELWKFQILSKIVGWGFHYILQFSTVPHLQVCSISTRVKSSTKNFDFTDLLHGRWMPVGSVIPFIADTFLSYFIFSNVYSFWFNHSFPDSGNLATIPQTFNFWHNDNDDDFLVSLAVFVVLILFYCRATEMSTQMHSNVATRLLTPSVVLKSNIKKW